MFRRLTLGIVLTAGLAVLILAVYLLWDTRQWDPSPLPQQTAATDSPDRRTQLVHDRMELLTKRLGDIELLVLILLGITGLYTIVFLVSTNSSATHFARQADRSISSIREQIGLAMGDLRELKEETRQILREESKLGVERLEQVHAEARQMIKKAQDEMQQTYPSYARVEQSLAAMHQRIAYLASRNLTEEDRLEVLEYESALAGIDLIASPRLGAALSQIYLTLGRVYLASAYMRARFYLKRSLAQAPPEQEVISETHYDLACVAAQLGRSNPSEQAGHFQAAVEELRVAFQNRSKRLDDWLARDIDEGGVLYELAGTPPFDKAVNDLLLNVSIGSV